MTKNDISLVQLEKLALSKNENKTYMIMNIYYGLSNTVLNTLTTEQYIKKLNEIIGD